MRRPGSRSTPAAVWGSAVSGRRSSPVAVSGRVVVVTLVVALLGLAPVAAADVRVADPEVVDVSVLAPLLVGRGCAVTAVVLPLVDPVTWFRSDDVDPVDASVQQPIDPSVTTRFRAELSQGATFDNGTTSTEWSVGPGGMVDTECESDGVAPGPGAPPDITPTPSPTATAPTRPTEPARPVRPAQPAGVTGPGGPTAAAGLDTSRSGDTRTRPNTGMGDEDPAADLGSTDLGDGALGADGSGAGDPGPGGGTGVAAPAAFVDRTATTSTATMSTATTSTATTSTGTSSTGTSSTGTSGTATTGTATTGTVNASLYGMSPHAEQHTLTLDDRAGVLSRDSTGALPAEATAGALSIGAVADVSATVVGVVAVLGGSGLVAAFLLYRGARGARSPRGAPLA